MVYFCFALHIEINSFIVFIHTCLIALIKYIFHPPIHLDYEKFPMKIKIERSTNKIGLNYNMLKS